ncbi:hypothetical protein FRC17_008758 [Serendipita sp. 399]|nr:hypothetical protein FRC17_008758 [Serendipita sp. 399]
MANLYIQPYRDGQSAVDRELEEKRRRLLVQLNGYDDGPESANASLTEDLKRRYNKIIDEQSDRRCGSFCDPLVALPPDVWTPILEMVIEEYAYGSLLILLHVSQAWTSKLISCPSLWTRIVVDPGEEDLLAKMAIFLQLSERSNIEIHFPPPKFDGLPNEVYQLLIAHKDRIISISHVSNQDILWILEKLGNLPNLQRLTSPYSGNPLLIRRILERVPSLRQFGCEIDGLSAEAVIETCLLLPNSTSFRITSPDSQSPSGGFEAQLTFRHLRHLWLTGNQSICFDFLSYLDSPLTLLIIRGCFRNSLHILVNLVARFPLLEILDVSIIPGSIKLSQQLRANGTPPTLSIWSLILSIVIPDAIHPGVDIEEELLGIIGTCMPFIKRLEMRNIKITPTILSMIQSLSQIQVIDIWHTSGSYPADLPPIFLPKLSQLRWVYDSHLRCFSHLLQASNLTSYESVYHSSFSPREVSVIPHADTSPRGCGNSLTRLVIHSTQPNSLSLQDLPALRVLDLGDRTPGYWVSDILEQLIILPKACPRLSKLVLGIYYVDWHILFLVLERRNFLDEPNVSPIREVQSAVMPCHGYLQAFMCLLGGRFPSSPRETCLTDKFNGMVHVTRSQVCYNCGTYPKEPINMWSTLRRESIVSFWGPQIISGWTYSTPTLDEKPDPPL